MIHGDCVRYSVTQSRDAAVAQSVERRIGSAEVTGPIPVSSSIKSSGNFDVYRVSVLFVCIKICRQLYIVNKLCIFLSCFFIQCLSKTVLSVIVITETLFRSFERLLYLYDSVSAKSNISGKYPNNNFIILHGIQDSGLDIH